MYPNDSYFMRYLVIMLICFPNILSLLYVPCWNMQDVQGWLHGINHPTCHFQLCIQLRWRHNGRDNVSNHQPHDCLINRLFRRRPKKTSKRRVTGLYAGNSLGTGEFPAQLASNAENVSTWWRHHGHSSLPSMSPTVSSMSLWPVLLLTQCDFKQILSYFCN